MKPRTAAEEMIKQLRMEEVNNGPRSFTTTTTTTTTTANFLYGELFWGFLIMLSRSFNSSLLDNF